MEKFKMVKKSSFFCCKKMLNNYVEIIPTTKVISYKHYFSYISKLLCHHYCFLSSPTMKNFPFLLLLLSIVFGGTTGVEKSGDEDSDIPTGVIKLTSRNFESKISDGSVWLVEFYADWCG